MLNVRLYTFSIQIIKEVFYTIIKLFIINIKIINIHCYMM